MNKKKILGRGYLPKELPPPFNSDSFSDKHSYITKAWNIIKTQTRTPNTGESNNEAKRRYKSTFDSVFGSSKCCEYNIPKGDYTRRKIEIPNPLHFSELCDTLLYSWKHIVGTHKLSSFSASTPIESGAKRSVRTKSDSVTEFRLKKVELSFDKRYEVTFDIVQFYPSIYTHSITWAVLGKEKAKYLFKIKNSNPKKWETLKGTDKGAILYEIFETLDTKVRNCQDKQSIGIPIGPDTSFIIAEIIARRLDYEIIKKIRHDKYTAIRYYDDYVFYTDNFDDAEQILKIGQSVFQEFRLDSNDKKAKISKYPFIYEELWFFQLISFKFSKCSANNLKQYFSIVFSLISSNSSQSSQIILFALSRFIKGYSIVQDKKTWDYFERFLLKTMLINATHLKLLLQLMKAYSSFIDEKSKKNIGHVLNKIITKHIGLNHSFEISWSLWIFKKMDIKVEGQLLTKVLEDEDDFSKLIALDLINSNLYRGRKPSLSKISRQLTSDNFMGSNWIFIYESFKKGWINPRSKKAKEGNQFMNILRKYEVEFYDSNRQVEETDIYRILHRPQEVTPQVHSPNVKVQQFTNLLLSLVENIEVDSPAIKEGLIRKLTAGNINQLLYEKLQDILKTY